MTPAEEDYFLNPPAGSAAERAVEFGIDLTLTLENLRLTPEERIRRLDERLANKTELKATFTSMRYPKDLLMLLELEAIRECQLNVRPKEDEKPEGKATGPEAFTLPNPDPWC
jgi:hypothetical protein